MIESVSSIEEASIDHISTDHTSTCHPENLGEPTASATSKTDDKKIMKDRILIVSDSNGNRLNLQQLKPGCLFTKCERFNLRDATNQVPKMTHPDEVKDIVFQVGLNDLRKGHSPKGIQSKILNMQIEYTKKFPNARQHVTALPPLGQKHNETNHLLHKLSGHTETNFISTKPLRDTATGHLRANVMDWIHYNEYGIKIMAKQIKKSLYSSANLGNKDLQHITEFLSATPDTSSKITIESLQAQKLV